LQVKPDTTVNRRELPILYFKHKERWDKAFAFLKENDFRKMELKRYEIDALTYMQQLVIYVQES